MNRKYLLQVLIVALAITTGCGSGVTETVAATPEVPSEPVVVEVEDLEFETVTAESAGNALEGENAELPEQEEASAEPELELQARSPLTGMPVEESVLELRPTVVMLDNHYGARPQAGLSQADHIYEILAEGRITRYMAVFQSGSPSPVGPVRSARPYFIDRALEYDPYYVHVGGSMQAMTDIINLNMADIDGLSSGGSVFWRTRHKRIPHNMYSSIEAISKESQRKGYRQTGSFTGAKFNESLQSIGAEPALYLKAIYKNPTSRDSVGYYIEFKYNEETKRYERFVNGKPHVDENDGTPLCADNIIVQIAYHKVIDDEGRRRIDLIGQGKGYFITNGEKQEITWSKSDRYARTVYRNSAGDEISFNPGVTWFQIVEGESRLGW